MKLFKNLINDLPLFPQQDVTQLFCQASFSCLFACLSKCLFSKVLYVIGCHDHQSSNHMMLYDGIKTDCTKRTFCHSEIYSQPSWKILVLLSVVTPKFEIGNRSESITFIITSKAVFRHEFWTVSSESWLDIVQSCPFSLLARNRLSMSDTLTPTRNIHFNLCTM